MGSASQQHKLDIRGYNSLGGRKALVKIVSNFGSDSVDAVLLVNGRWSSTDSIDVVTNIGAGNVTSTYSPGGDVTAEAAATAIASAIDAQSDHTATASSNVVRINKSTAGSVEVVSAVIS